MAIGVAIALLLVGFAFFPVSCGSSNDLPAIANLDSINLDTAETSNTADGVRISGARVRSSIYDLDDYLLIDYRFNLDSQSLEPTRIQAFQDVGPTTSGDILFFLRDQPGAVELTEGGKGLPSGSTIEVGDEPRRFSARLEKCQALGIITRVSRGSGKIRLIAPERGLVAEYSFSGNFFHTPLNAIEAGNYIIEIEGVGDETGPIVLSYNNNNGRETRRLSRDGGPFRARVSEFIYDYEKFVIELQKGEVLKITGNFDGAFLEVFHSNGKRAGGRRDTGYAEFVFEALDTGTYYLVYYQDDYSPRQSTFSYEVSPSG